MTSETLPPPPDAIKSKASTSFYNIGGCNKPHFCPLVRCPSVPVSRGTGSAFHPGEEYAHMNS